VATDKQIKAIILWALRECRKDFAFDANAKIRFGFSGAHQENAAKKVELIDAAIEKVSQNR